MNANNLLAKTILLMGTKRVMVSRIPFGKTKIAQVLIEDYQLHRDGECSVLSVSDLKPPSDLRGAPRIRVVDLDDLTEDAGK